VAYVLRQKKYWSIKYVIQHIQMAAFQWIKLTFGTLIIKQQAMEEATEWHTNIYNGL